MRYDFLQDNIIIVCNNFMKKKIINYVVENKLLLNIKYITKEELFSSLTFKIEEKCIYYVMKEFNISYNNAKMYLSNIKYLGYENVEDERIYFLEKIKNYCLKNNLLKFNDLEKKAIISKKIYFIEYNLNRYDEMILKENKINYEVIKSTSNSKLGKVLKFKDMHDEVNYIANRILELIEQGVSTNKIYLANINEDYDYVIDSIFKMYEIPYNKKYNTSLYETEVGLFFLDNLSEDKSETLQITQEKFKHCEDIIEKIINILNEYYFVDNLKEIKDVLITKFKKTRINNNLYKNGISIVDLENNVFDEDEYLFLVGFNLNVLPRVYKDEDYLSDNIKFSFMETSKEKNAREKENIKNILLSIPNLIITYKLQYLSDTFYPSVLISEMNLDVEKIDRVISNYSNLNNEILLAESLDNYFRFGDINGDFKKLLFNYSYIPYNTYDNKFKGINGFNKKMTLSYSSINNYYKCAFRYYLANVLKLDIYNENFSQYVGNLFHYVLSIILKDGGNINELYQEYLKNNYYEANEKEKYFLEILESELEFIVDTIKEQSEFSNFKDILVEQEIVVNDNDLYFKGFVDKILLKDDMAVIIDYKTGNIDINLNLVPYGLSLQLPVYIYLAKHYKKNIKVIGFYLQHILNSKPRRKDNKSFLDLKKDDLKLQGYSLGNTDLLEEFDSSYVNSEVIKSMKFGKNGFYSYAKVLTEKEIDNLALLVEDKINKANDLIRNAEFKINPKVMGNDNLGCSFCKFKDICYKKEEDKVYLPKIKDLSFLGGEDNA